MKKILIVDDNISFVGAMKELLKISGYEVVTAHNGKEALELLDSMKVMPTLIILDMIMPIMNGPEFRKAQLEDQRFSKIPVILLTANNGFKEFQEKLQAYEFLNKPVESKDLLYVVENFFFLNKKPIISV